MPEPSTNADAPREHPSVRFEPSDASFRAIMYILAGVVVTAVAIFFGVYLFFRGVQDHQARIKQSPYPLAAGPSTALPREPRLEQIDRLAGVQTPNVAYRELSRLKILNSYGQTQEKGFVHIPIDQAMQLVTKTLRSRPEPSVDQQRRSGGLVDAGESNSGRMFRRRER